MTVTHVTAIISPKPGKEARVQELIEAVVQGTTSEEKDATTYYLTKAVDSTDFVVRETYTSMAAFEFHKSQSYFKAFAEALEKEDLVSKPPSIIASEKISGFTAR